MYITTFFDTQSTMRFCICVLEHLKANCDLFISVNYLLPPAALLRQPNGAVRVCCVVLRCAVLFLCCCCALSCCIVVCCCCVVLCCVVLCCHIFCCVVTYFAAWCMWVSCILNQTHNKKKLCIPQCINLLQMANYRRRLHIGNSCWLSPQNPTNVSNQAQDCCFVVVVLCCVVLCCVVLCCVVFTVPVFAIPGFKSRALSQSPGL